MRKKGAALRAVLETSQDSQMGPGSSPGLRRTDETSVLLDFTPVPRRYRRNGWTPERQKAFIEALADTGCVTRAAAMVNIAQTNAYELRRAPGAEEFRRAWDAVLAFRARPIRDAAFERAMEGELVPVFAGGKLMGFRRKKNDALLMFILRHYGQDSNGKRTTIDYFSARARAGPSTALGTNAVCAGAQAAALLEGFEGLELDAEAQAAITAALKACAARARAADAGPTEGAGA